MRFPRTNLTDAGDFSSEIETDLPEENPGEKPAAPIWQSNFSLAPNVRFTRTPETLISRRARRMSRFAMIRRLDSRRYG